MDIKDIKRDHKSDTFNALNRLIELKDSFPKLTFDNNGYKYLSLETIESHKNQIIEIESILKNLIEGFVKFNNFKPRKDNSIDIRVQYHWSPMFTGVGYFSINKLKEHIDLI